MWSLKRLFIGLARRTFTRQFRREVGESFVSWRQQACLLVAIPRLVAGEAITEVAIELGYENPAEFTSMFKRMLGVPPRSYISRQDAETSLDRMATLGPPPHTVPSGLDKHC